jgi:hypothetical protein
LVVLVDTGATPQAAFFLPAGDGRPPAGRLAGAIYQPEEPPLEMDVADLRALRRAVTEVGDTPGVCTRSNGSLSTTASLRGTSTELS